MAEIHSVYSTREIMINTSHLIGLRLDVLGHVNLVANQELAIGRLAQWVNKNKAELILVCFITNQKTTRIYTQSTRVITASDETLKNMNKTWKVCIYYADEIKGSPYSITKRTVPELIPVLGSQPAARWLSHKPGSRLPLLSDGPAVSPAVTNFAAWWTKAQWVWAVLPKTVNPTVLRLQFEPGPFCTWVQHANHLATEPPYKIQQQKTRSKEAMFNGKFQGINTTTDMNNCA